MVSSAHSVVCQPTAAQLIDYLDYTPSPPPPLLVWSRGNGITEQRLCWQSPRQHRAQGWPFPFHPSPTSPKTGNTGRKQGHPDESVCQRAEGIESGFRAGGGKKELRREKSAKGRTVRVLTFVQGYRKENIFQFKSMLNGSGSSTSWPSVPWESLSFLFEI